MDKEQVFATTKVQDFSSWQPKKQKKTKKKKNPKILQSSSPWALHSLHAVLKNSIVQCNPILWHSINCWGFVSATHFIFAQLYALFPVFLTIPTWFLHILSKLHFLLLSLPFLFLYNNNKKRQNHSVPLLTRKKEQRRTKEKEPMYQKASKNEEFSFQAVGNFDSWKVGVVG